MSVTESEYFKPDISVIIDTYNYGRYIETAIDSVLNQSLSSSMYEVIVVDDGSQDDTRERVAKYIPRVNFLYKENGGQASAFNAGIGIARGEFVSFLDADDYWHPDKLEKVLSEFRKSNHIDVVYHSLRMVDGQGEKLGIFPKTYSYIIKKNRVGSFQEGMTPLGSATSGLSFRTSVLIKLLPVPKDFTICADGYLMMAAQFVAHSFAVIEAPLAYYRIHGSNLWATSQFAENTPTPQAKLFEIDMMKMMLLHVERLADKCCPRQHTTFKDIRLKIFCEEVYHAKQVYGFWVALELFFRGRHAFSAVKMSHRLFRTTDISLHLLLPFKLYQRIRFFYAQSFLWSFVQAHVK